MENKYEGLLNSKCDVLTAIFSERDYQRRRWGSRQEDGSMLEDSHSVGDFIVYMQVYMNEVLQKATTHPNDEEALKSMLKVVTLGVACFEQHGISPRDISGCVINKRDGQEA